MQQHRGWGHATIITCVTQKYLPGMQTDNSPQHLTSYITLIHTSMSTSMLLLMMKVMGVE